MSEESKSLPDHWIEAIIEDHIDFIDYRGKTPEKIESGMRLITAKNVKKGFVQVEPREFVDPAIYDDWMTRGIPKKGDVLFTTEAPLGNVAQLDTDDRVVFAQRIIIMQPDATKLDSTFLKYMLLSGFMQQRIQEKGTGATAKGIKSKLLKKIPIAFPNTVSEQKRIVSILDEAFGAIAKAKENAARNLANARELFDSYLNRVFTEKGDGWEETTVGAICERVEYGTSTKSQSIGQVPVLRMGNIQNREIDWTDLVYTDNSEDIEKYFLQKGDVLFNRTNSAEHVGKTCIYRGKQPAIFAGYLIRIHYDRDRVDGEYLNYYLNSDEARGHGKVVMSRSVNQANINGKKLKNYRFPLAPIDDQRRIVTSFNALRDETNRIEILYQQKLTALDELKQSLLQKAFTGQLTNKSAELELV